MQVRVVEDETCAPELEPARLAAIANRTDWDKMDWFMTGWTKQQVAPSQNTALACGLCLARSSLPHAFRISRVARRYSQAHKLRNWNTGLRQAYARVLRIANFQSSTSGLPRSMTERYS